MYDFRHLPAYAQFILEQHLDEFVRKQLSLSFKMKVPLLQHLKHLPEEQLFQQSKIGASELLGRLAANEAREHIEISIQRWLTNQLPLLGKYQVSAEDITIINFIRGEVLKTWITEYTNDLQVALGIVSEMDRFVLGQNTTAVNTYISILKEKIEEEANFSSNIITASPSITFIFDLVEQREVYVSGKVKEVMGHEPDAILAMGNEVMQRIAHPEDLPRIAQMIHQMVTENSDKTYVYEYRLRDRWDHYRWMRSYLVIFKRDEQGRPLQILGQTFDVSKEKELVTALEKREQELLEAQRIAKVGSFDWNLQTRTSEYTPALLDILESDTTPGYEAFINNIHPDDRKRVEEAMALSLENGQYECEYRYRVGGREKILWARGGISYQDGKPYKMIGTLQDITERKQIEDRLLEKTIMLEKSNAGLQEFASVASHDLKEPLRKMTTFADLLYETEKENLSEAGRNQLQRIMEASLRMRDMVDDILAFSSLSGTEEKLECSLKEIAVEAMQSLELAIQEKNARIELGDLPKARVFPTQMQQMFSNLISNAIKFSKKEEPPVVCITHAIISAHQVKNKPVLPAAKYLEIRVKDNGIGFSSDSKEKIFQLFQRLHTRAQYAGTGLGLAICRKVAENHGGTIEAHSEPGQGSEFIIVLPMD